MRSTTDPAGAIDPRAERDRFVAFAFAAAELLIEVGGDERISYIAGAARALTGRSPVALTGSLFCELFPLARRDAVRALLHRLRREKRMPPVELALEGRGEIAFDVVLNGCCLPERSDRFYFTVALRRGVPESLGAAALDRETKLLDRSGFQAVAVAALNGAAETQGEVALTLLDLAGIDDLRARSGVDAVTTLMGEIGSFLSAQSLDGAGGRLGPARFGVLQDAVNPADLGHEIERLSRMHDRDGRGLEVNEQIVQLAGNDLEQADAEKALVYTLSRFADRGGEGLPIRSLTDGFRMLVAETVGRITDLRSSVEARLAIVFQPVVGLADALTHHYEVLSRFDGESSPAETIQFAEGVGMIEEIDLRVAQRVLAFLDAARDNAQLKLAVNLSARSLRSDVFVSALLRLLQPRSDRKRLLFEVTETAEISDLARADRVIQDLRGAGHGVCLDDFGAGAASFPYLQALTVDFVKIDGGYVRRMMEAARDQIILKAMVRLCRDLGTATIAEMIETQSQRQRLADLGVQYGQGFLFGRPTAVPAGNAAAAAFHSGAARTPTPVGRKTMPPVRGTARRNRGH